MNCDICHRQHHPQRLPFLCPVDARNKLYEGRVAHAHMLIEADTLRNQVDAALSNVEASLRAAKAPLDSRILAENWRGEQQEAVNKTNEIIAQADRLRVQVETVRKEIEDRKAGLSRRKSDLASASDGIVARRSRQEEDAEKSIQITKYRWNHVADLTAATRSFLCAEAARLYGVRRLKKGSSARYEIGGIEIIELQSLTSMAPEVLSTCVAHIAHILVLASHYLHIRLPAEITLPHRDYPRPTIFSLASSYQHKDVPFPGTSSSIQSIPIELRGHDHQRVPRPRPLFVDKPLSVLAKDDPPAYSFFIEGVTLLAYNIAWACCSQGVPIGDRDSFDDVCGMGRNLYNLLIGNQSYNNPSGRIFHVPLSPPLQSNERINDIGKTSLMGRYSHGAAHNFLGSAEGNEFVRGFKIPSPIKLADRLKKKLSADAPIPDWELLEDDAWAVEENGIGGGIKGEGHKQAERSEKVVGSDKRFFGVESAATVNTGRSLIPSDRTVEKNKISGTGGWTKLRSR